MATAHAHAPHDARPAYGKGWKHWLSTTNHKEVGILYLVTSLFFFLVGGLFALLMRAQLATSGQMLYGENTPELYNQFVTMHGIVMIFFFLSPFAFAFGNYFVPIQLGAQDLIFPRLNALSYWMYLAGGIVSLLGFATGGAASGGWTLYIPLSLMQGTGVTLVGLGIILFVVGVTVSTINFLVTYFMLRAPGMKLYHMPLFSWAVFWTVVIMLFAFPALGAAGLMLVADRSLGFHFFDIANGGPILWAHLFWFFGHPEVYILLLPGLGAVLEIIPTFSQRPLYGKRSVIWALAIATILSFIVYVHHMFTTGVDPALRKFMVITTEMISIPFGVTYLCMIGTMWKGSIKYEVPMLFAIGFILLFLIGGLTGVFLSSVAIDYGMQGSYWVVAHFHYAVLGGGVWGILAGLYFWYPKITGRMFNQKWGRIHFWLGFVGFNLLFMSMFFYGKMPRRIYTYDDSSGYAYGGLSASLLNTVATVGAFMFALGVVLMLLNFIVSLRKGERAGPDPWGGDSLEWTMSSPPPPENFTQPVVLLKNPLNAVKDAQDDEAAGRGGGGGGGHGAVHKE